MMRYLFLLTAAFVVALPQAALAQHHGGGGHGGPGGGGGRGPGGGFHGAPHGAPAGGGGSHAGGGGPHQNFHQGRMEARPQFQQSQRGEGQRGQWRGEDHRGDWNHRGGDHRGDRGPGWNGGDHWRGGDHRGYGRGGGYHRIGGGRPYGFHRYHAPPFRYPRGWGYRRWTVGLVLPSLFLSSAYYWDDWGPMGVGAPPPGYHWVRYGPDLLLVSWRTGRVADAVYGAFY